jgi:uncharacterized membrane protein
MSSARDLVLSALAAGALWASGCGPREQSSPAHGAADSSALSAESTATTAPTADLTGIWTVVRHRIPGVSAMSDAEASRLHGTTVRLMPTEALSSGQHCTAPEYATRLVTTRPFLAAEYHLPPGALARLDALERFQLFEVSCEGTTWAALGGRLLALDSDHVIAPRDGVFFELERDHDFRAVGEEPFWGVQIAMGKWMRFQAPGEPDVVTPVPIPSVDPVSGTRTYAARTEANDLRVVIERKPCTDSMSGKRFEATVTVTLNGRTYHGCGEAVEPLE